MANRPETLKKYAESHRDKIAQHRKKYRENHKEELKLYSKKYREEHKEEVREKARKSYISSKDSKREYQRTLRSKYKSQFLEMYGNVCACCGESIPEFLTIEHKQGQKKIDRRTGLVAYRDAVKEHRPDLFEILCWNCNCAKGHLGYCPHNPPDVILPYKIHKVDKYNYTKEVDSLGRRYK